MSDIMKPVGLKKLLNWIIKEYERTGMIFGIPQEKIFHKRKDSSFQIFGEKCETALGPAAGPHTQQAENIVAAYLTGARFFELKTVQILDKLDIDKPCIDAHDEGYNTEWSTELTVEQAFAEYVKAWFLLHILDQMLDLSKNGERNFVFNMSVGYDLEGIKDKKVDDFIENLKDASQNPFFLKCKSELKEMIVAKEIPDISNPDFVEMISPKISNSITLSTMHGCPPEEQQNICKYLLTEKKLHTFLKMNPTLLGYDFVKNTFEKLGFSQITLKEESFTEDMQYPDAVQMLKILRKLAEKENLDFGVKLSNTLAVVNDQGILPTDEMYMSGRALFPLTINLVRKLSAEFDGNLAISFSGGANLRNIKDILECGIRPITMATELLKPGGYSRLKQIAELLEENFTDSFPDKIDQEKLDRLAKNISSDPKYWKATKSDASMKIKKNLPRFDCFVAPCKEACPIGQDVPEYLRLIAEKRYQEAFELIIAKNPLPHITGYICDHKCMLKCVRNDYEEPVLIRDLKLIAAQKGFSYFIEKLKSPPEKNTKIAIIGGGPAGLSSAYFLAKNGFDVTVFERRKELSGTVSHVIPDFRIPQEAIDNDLTLIKKMGVKFQLSWKEKLDLKKLRNAGFQYINLAIGAVKSRVLEIQTDNSNIFDAIHFLEKWKIEKRKIDLGKTVAVVGGGNSAMDGARAAIRTKGVKKVYILYRRTINEMPADREELENALQDGIEFLELLNPVSFQNNILKCQKMKLGKADESGRRRPLPIQNEFLEMKIDSLITAIGEQVDYQLLHKNEIEIDAQNKIIVNEFNETSVNNVFISGDALRGPATVVEAIADAQKVAAGISQKEGQKFDLEKADNFLFDVNKRQQDVIQKKAVINEAAQKLKTEKDIQRESARCLECNFICNKCVEVCPNRANVEINIPGFQNQNQILHIDGLCNECGNCETFCPYDGTPYKDKFTLFWSAEEMQESDNDGFFAIDLKLKQFRLKIDNEMKDIIFDQNWQADKSFENRDFPAIVQLIRTVSERYEYLYVTS